MPYGRHTAALASPRPLRGVAGDRQKILKKNAKKVLTSLS